MWLWAWLRVQRTTREENGGLNVQGFQAGKPPQRNWKGFVWQKGGEESPCEGVPAVIEEEGEVNWVMEGLGTSSGRCQLWTVREAKQEAEHQLPLLPPVQ